MSFTLNVVDSSGVRGVFSPPLVISVRPVVTSGPPPPVTGFGSVSVRGADLSGAAVTGMYVALDPGAHTGYVPVTWSGLPAGSYTATASDYLTTVFDHWEDGTRTSARTVDVVAGSGLRLVSFYRTAAAPPPPPPPPSTSGAVSSKAGLLIPLYTYPSDSSWIRVLAAVKGSPAVPFVVIANPNNGVGSFQDPVFLAAIKALQVAGAKVIGYIATGYGAKALGAIEAEASSWRSFYSVDGVFLDEFDNNPGSEALYSSVHAFVHSLGMPLVFGNPGTTTSPTYNGTVDYLVTWEMGGVPPLTFKGNYIAEGVPSLPATFPLPPWLWILDGNNSYAVRPLAPYFEQLVAVLARA